MLKLNIIGNNSVGRMYRPEKILNSEKRGFIFHTKYKSNFGGDVKKLFLEINLEYNMRDNTEVVNLEVFTEGKTKVAVDNMHFVSVNKKKVRTTLEDLNLTMGIVRKLIKPDNYNLGKKNISTKIRTDKGILSMDIYIDSEITGENEIVKLIVYPSIIDGKEAVVIDAKAKTPIVVINENGVILA